MGKDKRTYDVLIDVWNRPEPYFRFTLPKFSRGFLGRHKPWRIAPNDKTIPVHVLAGARRCLIAVCPDAVIVGSPAAKGKGYAGGLSIAISLGFLLFFGYMEFLSFKDSMLESELFYGVMFGLVCFLQSWFTRNWLCTPRDWPIIFNRKDRTVTYSPVTAPSFWKFWSTKVKQQFRTASWDEVRVRSYKYRQSNAGRSFHDSYSLLLLWGGEGGDPRALSQAVAIGYQGYFEDELLWMLWEHIRRYMEENGPAIPHGESLRPRTRGRPIEYPPAIIKAAGGPPLSEAEIARIAATAPVD